jgi:hypothetical protein
MPRPVMTSPPRKMVTGCAGADLVTSSEPDDKSCSRVDGQELVWVAITGAEMTDASAGARAR